eukprot:TRINITY_DN12521_c2_g1_i5.p2 TRINITY_DN12521_c2_g1~~TRINITY_DN12521_c2_g1_i5.p2  ORF type:complete len:121 (-),score=11.40 TRINITY_DN12521_c2_g1_i5:575-937(-)
MNATVILSGAIKLADDLDKLGGKLVGLLLGKRRLLVDNGGNVVLLHQLGNEIGIGRDGFGQRSVLSADGLVKQVDAVENALDEQLVVAVQAEIIVLANKLAEEGFDQSFISLSACTLALR